MKYAWILLMLSLSGLIFAAPEPISSQVMELMPGWNLVTIAKPLDEANKNIEHFLNLHSFFVDNEHKCYVRCKTMDDVKVGMGYWVFSRTQQRVELTIDVTQKAWHTVDAVSGWNLVGLAETSTWQDMVSEIWEWRNGCFLPVALTDIKVGKAYWIHLPSGD